METSSARTRERRAVLLERQPHDVAILPGVELGDLLCAVPAFRAIRAALPESRIALMGLLWARQMISRFPQYLDDFIALPGDDTTFELVIRLDGPGTSSQSFGGSVAGYARGAPGQDADWLMPYPDGEPEIRRHLKLAAWLGAEPLGEDLEFPVTRDDEAALAAVTFGLELERGRYVCLCPGSRNAGLRWPVERFAAVGDCLVRRGLRVVLIGTRADAELTAQVARVMKESAVDLGGKTRLGALAALIAGARLLVGNDSPAAHLAQALNTPSVLLFAPSDILRWGPLDRNRHRVLCPAARATPTQVMRCAESFLGMQSLRPHRSSRSHQELNAAS